MSVLNKLIKMGFHMHQFDDVMLGHDKIRNWLGNNEVERAKSTLEKDTIIITCGTMIDEVY